MSSPGKPHPATQESARFYQRPFWRVSVALTALGVGVLACSMPASNSASSGSANSKTAVASAPLPSYAEFQKTVQPFFASHCYECHGTDDSEAGVRLDIFTSDETLAKGVPTLEKAMKMLTARKMPPKDEPRPTEDEYHTATAWIDNYTSKYYMNGPIDPGRVTLHRLNRAEYNNTIHDLLGIDFNPADAFPVDDAGYGFDNNGDVLSIAPVLLEKYITAASLSLKKALFADPVLPPPIKEFDGATAEGDFPKSDPKAVANSRNGSGGRARPNPIGRVFQYYSNIYVDYYFPVEGDYVFSFRGYGYQGADGPPKAAFYIDTQQVGAKPFVVNTTVDNAKVLSTDYVHVTAGRHRIYLSFRSNTTKEQYLAAVKAKAATDAAAALAKASAPAASAPIVANNAPPAAVIVADAAAGQPAASTPAPVAAAAPTPAVATPVVSTPDAPAPVAVNNPPPADAKVADTASTQPAASTPASANIIATPATIAAVPVASTPVAAINPPPADAKVADAAAAQPAASTPLVTAPALSNAQGAAAPPAGSAIVVAAASAGTAGRGARGAPAGSAGTGRPPFQRPAPPKSVTGNATMAVVFFSIEGPEAVTPDRMPESYHRIMIAQPSATVTKAQAAEKIIRNFATRSYRRPATNDEVKSLMGLWSTIDTPKRSLEDEMSVVLQAVLANPNFLFRVEQDPQPGEAANIHTLNDYELASRLSYFLWSSMPDDELFALAAKGKLRANLDKEVVRMLKDPKAQSLVNNFAGQWLRLRQVENVSPDPNLYPAFDPELRESMLTETQMFFSSIKDEDRNVMDFIDADYSFINERLAKFYGIDGITGDNFRRVTFPKDSPRGGLITQASILTITSYNNRTSPVQRGKWVLENLLDSAPPPPPPNVPVLDAEKQLTGTLRQQMEQHRSNPTCAACHERMDAIGFSLENFDAIGSWRAKDSNNVPIDASGKLPDGTTFDGAQQLKQVLMLQKDQFCRCLADKMLIYAIGRGTEPSDKRTIDGIVTEMNQGGDKFSSLVKAIVHSDAFQKRRGAQPDDDTASPTSAVTQSGDNPKTGDHS
jgi:hypothetical protein